MKPLIILLLSTLPVCYGSSMEIGMDASLIQPPPPVIQGAVYPNYYPSTSNSLHIFPPFQSAENNSSSILYVFAIPDSPENCLNGICCDSAQNQYYLRVRIMTPAKKGGANNAIINLLAQTLGIDTAQIHIIRVEATPYKEISVPRPISELERVLGEGARQR